MRRLLFAATAIAVLYACQESLEDKCTREAKEYTKKNCPARIGENTIIDSLTFDRDTHTMHYYYTLTGNADNKENIEKSGAGNALLENLRNSTTTRVYKEAGYNFKYTYYSEKEKGCILLEKTFTAKDYK